MARLELRDIGNQVLTDIDLVVDHGQLCVIMGPSGAGKTSLLKVVAGLMPYHGSVLVDGQSLDRVPPHRRGVGLLFQELFLFPHLTVTGNLLLAMKHRPGARADKMARAMELLNMLRITDLAGRKPALLSGGEKQRAALARALASEPRILLLDEPLSSVDDPTASALRLEFKQLQRKLGLTTLYVTHNPDEARDLADSMAVIQAGRIEDRGGAERYLNNNRHGLCQWAL
jgi:ABC-type sugar transport system ATPase subunit